MATKIQWFSLAAGLVLGAGGTAALEAVASPGDAVYRASETKRITPAQAGCVATCLKNAGVWSGQLGAVTSVQISKSSHTAPDGGAVINDFVAQVDGLKTAPLSSIDGGGMPITIEGVAK